MRSHWLPCFALLLVACGGEQKGPRGPTFCSSYERNYMQSCRQQCGADLELTDNDGHEECSTSCQEDLEADETWTEDCAKP